MDKPNKFDIEIVAASTEPNLEDAKKQWEYIYNEKSESKKLCICGHQIKNVNYFLNTVNGNIICCGSTCCTKFEFPIIPMKNSILENIFKLKKIDTDTIKIENIKDYLEYAKNELLLFLENKTKLAKFDNLILILKDLILIKEKYSVDTFDEFIESIKNKLVELIPEYINFKINEDISLLEPLLVKLAKLVTEYKLNIQKSKIIDLTKETIASLVKHRIDNYTGEQTCSLQTKISKIVISLKILVLKDFLVGMETKLKNKIESIRVQNFAWEKEKYERRMKMKKY
uniref:Uncharacterized protein n=1 Tax=viral metagenome TaxID=1070528 RepID=A0A6C0DA13_9ZZZZ